MNKLPETATRFVCTVELRTYEETLKGAAKGKGFEWVCVEAESTEEAFMRARGKAFGEGHDITIVMAATLLITNYSAAWDADGQAVGNWRG